MKNRSLRSASHLRASVAPSQQIIQDTRWIYSKYIYQDLVNLRNSKPHNSKKIHSVTLQEINTSQISKKTENPKVQEKKPEQISFHSPAQRASLLQSDKKNSITEICKIQDAIDNETCRHTDEKYTIMNGKPCATKISASHFVGSNTKKNSITRTQNKENIKPNNNKVSLEGIVEEVLFLNGNEGGPIEVGTAEFKNPLKNEVSNNKDMQIDVLRKTLSKAMKIIKCLQDQLNLLSGNKATQKEGKNTIADVFFPEQVTESNLEQISQFLDLLQFTAGSIHETSVNKKIDQLAEKYDKEVNSLNEVVNQNKSQEKTKQKGLEAYLSPIQAPKETTSQNELMELYKEAEEEMEHKDEGLGGLQMTFQNEEGENNTNPEPEPEQVSSSSSNNWKTFIVEPEAKEKNNNMKKQRHNKSCTTAMKPRTRVKKDARASEVIDHQLDVSGTIANCNNTSMLDENLSNIEEAMSNFLGGFQDLKSELSQLGEVMQSCSGNPQPN